MKAKQLIYISFSVVLLLLVLSYYFLYNIYEIEIKKSPAFLYAKTSSSLTIEVIPINALGTKAWFRTVSAQFEIIEGKELIEVENMNSENGILVIKSTGKTGKVGIKIFSKYSLLPQYVEVEILPLTV